MLGSVTGGALSEGERPRDSGLTSAWELWSAGVLAVGAGLSALSLKSATTIYDVLGRLGLFLTLFVAVNAAHYYTQRRSGRTLSLRSYVKSDTPWTFLAVAFVIYVLVAAPTALA